MKTTRLIFILHFVLLWSNQQIFSQVKDFFDDGEFHINPAWTGDTSKFKINTNKQLQLKGLVADTAYLSTMNNQLATSEWNFWIKLSFNTSANNYARVYLVSDKENIKGPLNGYFLQIGGSEDSLIFYKQKGFDTEKLFTGTTTITSGSTNTIRVKMVFDSLKMWHLWTDNTGGNFFEEEGCISDSEFETTQWFGFFCKYTSSNSGKFYFDDVLIEPIRADTIPPSVKEVKVSGGNQLELKFSEPLDKTVAENELNYSTVLSGNPDNATVTSDDPSCLVLSFANDFQEPLTDTIMINSISDLSGNRCSDIRVPFFLYQVKNHDIVITEVMADPGPTAGLPLVEYVELYNRTKFPINLKDWFFQYGSHSKFLPEAVINPESFIILTQGDSLLEYGNCIDLFTSSSSLLNEGCPLVLQDNSGNIIHCMSYMKSWHHPAFKEEGGWSLEIKDPENPCECQLNWGSSESIHGGTPGEINSLNSKNPDIFLPYLKSARLISEHTLEIQFSETMKVGSLLIPNTFLVDQGIGFPDSVSPIPPFYTRLELWFQNPFRKGQVYQIRSNDLPTDCVNNHLDTSKRINVAIPDSPFPGDVVINEILADPYVDGERFVELFNRSKNVLDLSDLLLAGFDSITGSITTPVELVTETVLFFPGDYCILTKDPDDILTRYFSPHPDNFIGIEAIPSYHDDGDIVVIVRKNDNFIIDKVYYSKDMHSPLFSNTEGISLERINPWVTSEEKTNWHSAGSICGYATPAYQNSQFRAIITADDWVKITPAVISPDNDGIDDILQISFRVDKPGYFVSVCVYNDHGIMIIQLVNNHLVSENEQLIWNGTGNSNEKIDAGIYLLNVTFLHPDGSQKKVKKAIVIAADF